MYLWVSGSCAYSSKTLFSLIPALTRNFLKVPSFFRGIRFSKNVAMTRFFFLIVTTENQTGDSFSWAAPTRDLGKDTISTELQPLREVLKLINSWFGSRLLCNAYLTLDTVTWDPGISPILIREDLNLIVRKYSEVISLRDILKEEFILIFLPKFW